MNRWSVTYDQKLGVQRHAVASGFGQGLLTSVAAHVFGVLRLSATLFVQGDEWVPIHTDANPLFSFEYAHGLDIDRGRYNARCFAEVYRRKKPVRGTYLGFSDLFVPLLSGKEVVAILVTGPFATERPRGKLVLERWLSITGRHAHRADPEFAAYLTATLETLFLDRVGVDRLERVLVCLTQLMSGENNAAELANRAVVLTAQLEGTRFVERAWDAAKEMLGERSWRIWQSAAYDKRRRYFGLPRSADALLVALTLDRTRSPDPVEAAIRQDEFQRRSVELARATGHALAGQVGFHGVVFLSCASGSLQQKRRRLDDIADRARRMAERFDLSLHWGALVGTASQPTTVLFESCLAAAESALTQGVRTVVAEFDSNQAPRLLRDLRKELGDIAEDRPDLLSVRFDRYLEAIAARCGDRLEAARAHLESGFERMTDPLLRTGVLEERSFLTQAGALDRAALEARTVDELLDAYRRGAAAMSQAALQPAPARRDRSLHRAVEYIHRHQTEPLKLSSVARVAGFAPNYFSELFKSREGTTFEHYVRDLRIERSKQLLAHTGLDVNEVARISGFSSSQYFCRVFRTSIGQTPMEYRAKAFGLHKRSLRKVQDNLKIVQRRRR